jgi:hypothetical protein
MRIVISLAVASMLAAAPVIASAQDYGHDRGYGDRGYGDRGYGDRGYGDRGYGDRSVWRPHDSYGRDDDICARKQAVKTQQGAVTGAVIGAIAGYALGGRGHKVAGAALGGAGGAVVGGSVAHSNFRCAEYPRGYYAHRRCRWVEDDGHGFEICRSRDGEWRPYRNY